MRALLYLRLSESDEASTSIARQEADLRLRADREGWDVVEVLTDDGLSGGKDRDNALAALAKLRRGDVDVLAVWKFDRWSRQGLGALAALIEALDANPAALFVADRDGLTSGQPAWRIIAAVLAEVARMERENIQARVRSSVSALRKGGRYSGGTVPMGYRPVDNPNGPGRVLVIEEAEAAIVREAASRVLSGESLYAVVVDLNDRAIPTRRGATWSIQALRQILTSDTILGRVTHRGAILRDDSGMPVDVWPPVLDGETWHRLRAVLDADRTAEARPQRRRRSRLLSGVASCAVCGSRLYVKHNGAGVTSYACTQRSNGRPCPGVSVSAELLEAHVTKAFLAEVGTAEVMTRVEEAPEDAALAGIEGAVAATLSAMDEEGADIAALAIRLSTLKARRTELRSSPSTRVIRLAPTGETFADAWERGSLPERQTLLAANVAVLAVGRGVRGRRGLDADRVTLVAQPAHSVTGQAAECFREGRVAV